MFRNIFFLAVMVSILVAGVALADGGFYGRVIYKNCDCTYTEDWVDIWPAAGGSHYPPIGIDCRYGGGYNTRRTYPPGYYYLVAITGGHSRCDRGMVQLVYHGSDWQEVNLVVLGPTPTPNGGEGEE